MKFLGDRGEEKAAKHLKKRGYKILERNYRVHNVGEIDIIARDGEYTVFVEVKYRKSTDFGRPEEYVTQRKRERLIRAAEHYIQKNHLETPVRFDVVSLVGEKFEDIEVIKSAFTTL